MGVRYLGKEKGWILPANLCVTPGVTTPFENMKTVWFAANPTACKEQLSGGFFFHLDGQLLEVFQRDLQLWGTMAKKAIANIHPALEKLLPDGFRFLKLQVGQIQDDFSMKSLFQQEHNHALLAPVGEALKGPVFSWQAEAWSHICKQ
jgi:hypothetical protein